jgi:methylated-DNA-[protein]-cysteine S-methyltransferase
MKGFCELEIDFRMFLSFKLVESSVGILKLVASEKGLVAVLWENDDPRRVRLEEMVEEPLHPWIIRAENELKEYFQAERSVFSIPLDIRGTHFQKQVWNALMGIPFGETRTYSELAKQLGDPKATRAVGAANRRNPISIIVPCHRVIGASGNLTGFAGGLKTKAHLLGLEAAKRGRTTVPSRISRL